MPWTFSSASKDCLEVYDTTGGADSVILTFWDHECSVRGRRAGHLPIHKPLS